MLVAFIPVLHKGYLELFRQYPENLGILGLDVIQDYTSLTRDLRIIDPSELKQAIEALSIFKTVSVLSKDDLTKLGTSTITVVMPDEDISRDLATKYFVGRVKFTSATIRNRWDKKFVSEESVIAPHRTMSTTDIDRELIKVASTEAENSADWWRQIGALAVKDGQILFKHRNRHLPTDYHLAYNGDPRSNFDRGERPDIYTAIHAEAGLVTQAAKTGTSLDGVNVYVTTFPCPNCARLLAEAGVKKVFYQHGYSILDAEEIFKAYEVEIILVTP